MTRERHLHPSWCVLAALALPLGAEAQFRRGNEFQVNTYTTGVQRFPSVARRRRRRLRRHLGEPDSQDGSSYGVFAHRFSSAGAPLASEFQVNTYTTGGQRFGTVASDADGDFVVAWWSDQDGSVYGIFARRFSSAGAALASEFQVNTYTPLQQRQPSVAADADGDFVVVWQSTQDGSGYGIFGRAFSSAGTPLASEFQVNTYTPDYQKYTVVAADDDLDFVVVWASKGQDGSSYGVFGRRFSSAGTPLASEFQVNTYTTGQQAGGNRGGASVAVDGDGDFVVAWWSTDQDGSSSGVFARRFSSAGAALASEFQVNTYTTGGQDTPSVTTDADGDFVVTWHSNTRTVRPTASSLAASRARAPPWPPSSRSTPTPRATSAPRRWRRPPTATSSSPGRATTRTARATASSPSASPPRSRWTSTATVSPSPSPTVSSSFAASSTSPAPP